MKTSTLSIIGLVVAGFTALSTLFIVEQTQQGIVLQFGEPKRTLMEPGLNWKLPFIQDVVFYEKRVLSLVSSDSEEVILLTRSGLRLIPMPATASLTRCCFIRRSVMSVGRSNVLMP